MSRLPYPLLCALLGVSVGWIPRLLHGPIPEKYDVLYIKGTTAVWGWYLARCLIGFLVGITTWPKRWWLRGPMIGLLAMLPLGFVSLATPGCGPPCMFWNVTTGALVGAAVGGIAFAVTRRHHRVDPEVDT
jgi:hypothetical protein